MIDGVTLAVITVPRGPHKPYQTLDGRYLIRVGSTNRDATQPELMRLFQAAGMFHFDAIPVSNTSIHDLNLAKVDQYFQRYQFEFSRAEEAAKQRLLINSDMMATNGELTVAGLLVFGINPSRYLRHAYVTFAHFAGRELSDELLDRQLIEGSLDYQIDTGLAVIKNNWRLPSVIQGTRRALIGQSRRWTSGAASFTACSCGSICTIAGTFGSYTQIRLKPRVFANPSSRNLLATAWIASQPPSNHPTNLSRPEGIQ